MKRLLSILIFFTCSSFGFAGEFSIIKVNRIEKMWVIPPDRRTFIGSRGIQKFDYLRPIRAEEQGEHYVVTWRYRGSELASPLVLRFEYVNQKGKGPQVEEYTYTNLKSGGYRWTFKNIGSRYVEEGKVDRWKVSLVLDGKVVAERRSATWRAMEGT